MALKELRETPGFTETSPSIIQQDPSVKDEEQAVLQAEDQPPPSVEPAPSVTPVKTQRDIPDASNLTPDEGGQDFFASFGETFSSVLDQFAGDAEDKDVEDENGNLSKEGEEVASSISNTKINMTKMPETEGYSSVLDKNISAGAELRKGLDAKGKSSKYPTEPVGFARRIQKDLNVSPAVAAAFAGNGAVESAGFKTLQETNPTVKGSRGGFGWFQWTGPRRRQFEKFSKANGLDPSSPEANYRFFIHEVKNTPESSILKKLEGVNSPSEAAKIISKSYLRPGIPHNERRMAEAEKVYASLSSS